MTTPDADTPPETGPAAPSAAFPPDAVTRMQQIAAASAAHRLAVRAAAPRVPLTVGGLLAKLGLPRGLAEHLMYPYCTCQWQDGAVFRCAHAYDLGL